MSCININHPNYKALLKANDNNPLIVNAVIRQWQLVNESTDIPTLEELKSSLINTNKTQIKPGVEELFESNPELANAVYEALGFTNKQELENLKKEFYSFSNIRDKFKGDLKDVKNLVNVFSQVAADANFYKPFATNISEQRKKDIISGKATSYIWEDNFDNYRKTIEKSLTDELESEKDRYNYWFDDGKNFYTLDVETNKYYKYNSGAILTPLEEQYEITKKEYYEALDDYKDALKEENLQEQEDVKENVLRQPFLEGRVVRLFDNHFVIVTNHTIKEEGGSFINEIEFIYYDEFDYDRLKELEKQQITPQQKQQAQQLYSQYLDTIFPDSKFRDIFYRGGYKQEKETPRKYMYFTKIKEMANSFVKQDMMGREFDNNRELLFALINTINPKEDIYLLGHRKFSEASEQGIDALFNRRHKNKPDEILDEIVNFKSEQIHILGSKQDIEGFKEFVNKQDNEEAFQFRKDITDNTLLRDIILEKGYNITKSGYFIDKLNAYEEKEIQDLLTKRNALYRTNYKLITTKTGNKMILSNNGLLEANQKETKGVPDEQLDSKIQEFLQKLGIKVNIGSVTNKYGEPIPDVIARAKYVKNQMSAIIDIVEGKQGYDTLTEEAVHFLIWMMRGTPLYNSMIVDVVKTDTYKEVKSEYKNVYVSELQFKEEAMAKLITKSVIEQFEKGTKLSREEYNNEMNRMRRWWNRVMEFLKELFTKYKANAFDLAAMQLLFGDTTDLSFDNIGNKEEAYQLSDISSQINDVYNTINQAKISLIKTDDKDSYFEGDFEYKRRVTQKTHRPLDPASRTDLEKRRDEFLRNAGTLGHEEFNNSLQRAIELKETGSYKTAEVLSLNNRQVRNLVDDLVNNIIDSYGPDARFFTEKTIGDKVSSTAGTVDFFVIYNKNNKVAIDILDFKFTEFKTEKGVVVLDEMPYIKKQQYSKQLEEYKRIIRDRFNFKGEINAYLLPVNMQIGKTEKDLLYLKNIEITNKEFNDKKLYLNRIPLETNKTGVDTIDEVVEKLVAQKERLLKIDISKDKQEEVIKHQARIKSVSNTIKKILLTKKLDSFFEESIQELVYLRSGEVTDEKVRLIGELLPSLSELNFIDYIESIEDKEVLKALKEKINDYRDEISYSKRWYEQNLNVLVENVTNNLGVSDINLPQKDIGWWAKTLSYFSSSQNKHIQSLYKLWIKAKDTARLAFEDDLKTIEKLTKGVKEFASSQGISGTDAFDYFVKRDSKGNLRGIDKYSKESINKIKVARANKDYNFFTENYEFDKEAYTKAYEYTKTYFENRYKDSPSRDKIVIDVLTAFEKKYDVRKSNYAKINNKNYYYKLIEGKLDYSEEYKTIVANKPLKDFYDYFQEFIKKSRNELGLDFDGKFIPQIMQSTMEALSEQGSDYSFFDRLYTNLSASEQGTYGELNVLTGKMEYKISMPYQTLLGKDASKDLGKVLALWSKKYHDVKHLRDVENSAQLLLQHLEKQKFYQTDWRGNIKTKQGTSEAALTNAENTNTLKAYLEYLQEAIYGIKSTDSPTYSKKRKRKVFNDDGTPKLDKKGNQEYEEYEIPISVNKIIDKILRYISTKGLGLNVISAGANLGGGIVNGVFIGHKGQLYNKKQFVNAIKIIGAGSLNSQTKALMRYFDITGNMEGFNKANALSVSAAEKFLTYDKLFVLQRKGDEFINNTVLFSMLQSHGLNSENKIKPLSQLPEGTKSLLASVEIVNDEIQIKGLTDASDKTEFLKFRRKVHKTVEIALGSSPDSDIRLINQTVGGRILMQFRNWLPRMAEARFLVGTRYNENLEIFERGNYASFISFLSNNTLSNLGSVSKMYLGLGSNIDEILENKWELLSPETKKLYLDKTSNEAEAKAAFIATEKGNIKAAVLELQLFSFMLALIMFLKGDDDDEETSALGKYGLAMSERLYQEITFFVNPNSALQIIKSPAASSSTVLDTWKIAEDFIGQSVGVLTGDEEMQKKNKPIKRISKMFPVATQGIRGLDIMFGDDYYDNLLENK